MSKSKATATAPQGIDPLKGPIFSVRFLVSLLLIAAGIAAVVLWTIYLHDTYSATAKDPKPIIPGTKDLKNWNWVIGFGLIFVGLILAAHRKTPLGRGRGPVVGMLGCFLIGLIWICTFYVFANKAPGADGAIWLLSDLQQYNLMVGIGFMAVGFTYATKWE
ncbi:cell division protein CrgA [Nocardioides jejuensis]|uniref:Cell division protein CrgA n=1 Tax=Nocardioides jejuensis TaxID=2502782 RepID=A0A4R1CGQ3_9ACTN|nr:cell division protein CrgA [Nocardioides jejuensis]TCJ30534.1 cell division protein CrgA [Nocardioides jejuensis]